MPCSRRQRTNPINGNRGYHIPEGSMHIKTASADTLATTAAEIQLSAVSPKDKPWDIHRANSDRVKQLYESGDWQKYAERVKNCSQWLEFAPTANQAGSLDLKLRSARFCRVRQCPVCQWRRSLMWRARFFQAVPKLLTAHPKSRFIFLTLTVRNCAIADLRSTLKAMNKSWERLSKRKEFPSLGWVKATEVTRGKDGTAHPHFHAILMVPESYFKKGYLSQARWTELWQKSLRVEYTPVVNVKAVKARPGSEGDATAGITAAVLETLKYGVKESDLIADREWLIELTRQLHKTRAVAVGGLMREFIREEEPDDLIHDDEETQLDETFSTLHFGWRERVEKYIYETRE
jgi:plasmid rolling circle replication initiator protein Rep